MGSNVIASAFQNISYKNVWKTIFTDFVHCYNNDILWKTKLNSIKTNIFSNLPKKKKPKQKTENVEQIDG